MMLLSPRYFMSDPQARPFVRDERHDLTSADAPTQSQGRFIVYSRKVPRGQVEIITAISPYVAARSGAGASQTVVNLSPEAANGWFLFEPQVDRSAPFRNDVDFVSYDDLAGATDAARVRANGITHVSANPFTDARNQFNQPSAAFSALVKGGSQFEVIFSLIPTAGISLPYAIGSTAKRVDFAGCLVMGIEMSQQAYDAVVHKVQNQEFKGMSP